MDNQHLPIISFLDTMKALRCTKPFIYKLIKQGKLTPKYINRKVFFYKEQILEALSDESNVKPQKTA